jgi:hypothetical protein
MDPDNTFMHWSVYVTKVMTARPAEGHYSILAECGQAIERFREFVVFKKQAIKIGYLVCFTRNKHYCSCGQPVRERTFFDNVLGARRRCITCPEHNSWRLHCPNWA